MNKFRSENELGSIEVEASMDHWDQLINFGSDHIDRSVDDRSRVYKLKLAYEELLSNIIRAASEQHGDAASISTNIEVSAIERTDDGGSWFILRTRDTGTQFNPNFKERPSIDRNQPVHERAIGGLGLFLIRESVDHVSYEWSNGRNVYELCMQSTTQAN